MLNTFFDLAFQLFNLLLLGIVILLLALFLRLFIKKNVTLLIVMIVVLSGVYYVYDRMQHTTFDDMISEQLNGESTVESIDITIYDMLDGISQPEEEARVTIEDEAIVERIMDDFSGLELREDRDSRSPYRDYRISMATRTSTAHLVVDRQYIDHYEIVDGTDHLNTIESLVDSAEVD